MASNVGHSFNINLVYLLSALLSCFETRVELDFVTIQNRIFKLNYWFLILIKVSDYNLNQFVLAM